MPRLRLFILWIVCVCVPLQGWAAAMASCGAGHAGDGASMAIGTEAAARRAVHAVTAAVAIEQPAHAPAPAGSPGSDHAEAEARRGHGEGDHPCHDGIAHADTHDSIDLGASADAPHACGTCAACAACHAAAPTGPLDAAVLHDLPPADLAEPALVATTHVPRVPDRPPRA